MSSGEQVIVQLPLSVRLAALILNAVSSTFPEATVRLDLQTNPKVLVIEIPGE